MIFVHIAQESTEYTWVYVLVKPKIIVSATVCSKFMQMLIATHLLSLHLALIRFDESGLLIHKFTDKSFRGENNLLECLIPFPYSNYI